MLRKLTDLVLDIGKQAKKAALYLTIGAAFSLPSVGCKSEEESKYKGKSYDELKKMISNPRELQDFINDIIEYDNHRASLDSNVHKELNGAYTQSARMTLSRKKGICDDGARFGDLISDDGYPCMTVTIYFSGSQWPAHALGVVPETKNGVSGWRSFGINATDYDWAPTLEELCKKSTKDFGAGYDGYSFYDFSHAPWALENGTTNGYISNDPFFKESVDKNGNILSTGNPELYVHGFKNSVDKFANQTKTTTTYTPDAFVQTFDYVYGGGLAKSYWELLARAPNNLPSEEESRVYSRANLTDPWTLGQTIHEWKQYNSKNFVENKIEEIWLNGQMNSYKDMTFTFLPTAISGLSWQTKDELYSNNGDKIIDGRVLQERQSNGTVTEKRDENPYDGQWD